MKKFLPLIFASLLLGACTDPADDVTQASKPAPSPTTEIGTRPTPDGNGPGEGGCAMPNPAGEVAGYIPPDSTGMQTDVFALARRMDTGFNIGNTLECPGGENAWGNPDITPELLRAVRDAGFGAVRLPVAWNDHATDGIIDVRWLDRVRQVVDYAMDAGLIAIINCHWDGGWLENSIPNGYSAKVDALQRSYWHQIAVRFRDYDERLIFAGCNEPNVDNATQMKTLARYEQTFVDAVRATGGRNSYRVLAIQGPSTDINKTVSYFSAMPKDVVEGRLMAEVHYYDPYQFTLMGVDESWGKCFYFWGDANKAAATKLGMSDRWSTWGGDSDLRKQMAKMKTKFVDKGIPVILGEYGALMERDKELAGNPEAMELNRKSIADFHESVAREAKKAGIVAFLWDTGAAIDRRTCELKSETLVPAVLRGASSASFPY